MAVIEQQPYNLFAQQKRAGYPSSAQTPAESQPVEAVATPQSAAQPQVQAQPVVQQKPVAKAAGTVALQPGSSTAGMDYLNSLYTDPKEEERLRKASVMNQRILAIGDAVRHIGNIANTVNYAPAQQFNDPVAMEQARYEKGKALRDRANQQYYSYQQQKAAQDAAQRKWDAQFRYNTMKDARDYALRKSESDARNSLREAQLNRYQTMIELDNARKEGIISDNEWRKRRAELYPAEVQSRINKNNRTGSGRSGGGSRSGKGMDEYTVTSNTEYTYNADGTRTGSKTTKTRTVNGKQQPTQTTTNAYGGVKHGSGGKGQSKANKFGVRPAK